MQPRTVVWSVALFTLVGGPGCGKHNGSSGGDDTATTATASVAVPVSAAPTASAAPSASAAPASQCHLALHVGTLHSSGGISDPDLHSGSTSTMNYLCTGGRATAQFGKHSFVGTYENGHVQINASSTYSAFGCPWQTAQTISGTPPNLTYSYNEHPVPPCRSSARPTRLNGPVSAN